MLNVNRCWISASLYITMAVSLKGMANRPYSFTQEECGLVNLDHFRNVYLLYHQKQLTEGKI
jgi:hypothetical protein